MIRCQMCTSKMGWSEVFFFLVLFAKEVCWKVLEEMRFRPAVSLTHTSFVVVKVEAHDLCLCLLKNEEKTATQKLRTQITQTCLFWTYAENSFADFPFRRRRSFMRARTVILPGEHGFCLTVTDFVRRAVTATWNQCSFVESMFTHTNCVFAWRTLILPDRQWPPSGINVRQVKSVFATWNQRSHAD